jgi:hypothetical protein
VKQRGWQALSDRVAAANTADPAWAALLAGG